MTTSTPGKITVNADRLWQSLMALAEIGAYDDDRTGLRGVNRLALTDTDATARHQVITWMEQAALTVRIDRMGNIYGRREGTDPTAPPVLTGSHIDSVATAGAFDGCLGVLGGIEVVRTLNEHGIRTRHPIEVAVFTEEEGVRFGTVGLADYDGDPLDPQVRDGRMYGRGGFDMKGGIAAMMVAAARATADGPLRGDVLLACVADEEYGSSGTEEVLESFTADAAIVTEPSHLEVTLAHKGFAWFEVEIEGRAAHGSRPDLGIDAIAKAGHFLVALEELGRRLARGPAHPLLGTGTAHASVIHGGEEASTYPARCRVTLERRTVPGENADTVERELTTILDGLAATVPDFRARLTRGLHREPFEADPHSPIVRALTRHAERALGLPPVVRAEPYWTDCALLDRAGIPCLLFGVDGEGAHAATEYVDLASLDRLTGILTETVTEFCS